MKLYPQGIYNSFRNNELNFTYAHSVLQSLCFLDSTQKFFSYMNDNNMRNNINFQMANELLNLIQTVNSGNRADSKNILYFFGKYYTENINNLPSKNALSPDPFHFFYFLLYFLHLETNMVKQYDNRFFKLGFNSMKNDNEIYREFLLYIIKTQNSLISTDFISSVRFIFDCPKCETFYYYTFQSILRINIDFCKQIRDASNPNRKGATLDLSELLEIFCSNIPIKCGHCGNDAKRRSKLCLPGKTIIISLERNQHTFSPDVKFDLYFNFFNYISKSKTQGMNLNTNYELKAVISYANIGNEGKYFADCKIKGGNCNDFWARYIDYHYFNIQQNDLFTYEPQILIYEVNNNNTSQQQSQNFNNYNINNQIYNNMNNNNQNIINNNNYYMMNGSNTMENMNKLNQINYSAATVGKSVFAQMNPDFNNQNYSNNNMINVCFNNMNNNPFMQQIKQYNNINQPNMKIDFGNQNVKNEISISDSQKQNINLMNPLVNGYMLNGDFMMNIK